MTKAAQAARNGASQKELGALKDRYSKAFKEDHGPEHPEAPVNYGEYDREGDMAKDDLRTIDDAAEELYSILQADENLPEWVQSKITKAVDYIDTARDYMKAQKYEPGVAEGMFTKAPAIDPIIGKQINSIINRLHNHAKQTKDEYLRGTVQELFDILRNTGGTYSAPGSPGVRDVAEARDPKTEYDRNLLVSWIQNYIPHSDAGKQVQRYFNTPDTLPPQLSEVVGLIDEIFYESLENGSEGDVLPDEKKDLRFFYQAVKQAKKQGVAEDEMSDFLDSGGKITQVPYKQPRKGERLGGSRHIGGGGDPSTSRHKGISANTQGNKVIGLTKRVAETKADYKIKSIGTDSKGDYYISPSTGKKVYQKAKVGDHENPKTGEHKGVSEGANYWTKLQDTRSKKINSLVDELEKSIQ